MMPVMPTLLSRAVTRDGSFMSSGKSTMSMDGVPMRPRACSFTVPFGSPPASTPTSLRSSLNSPASVAFEKPIFLPAALVARAKAALLKAP